MCVMLYVFFFKQHDLKRLCLKEWSWYMSGFVETNKRLYYWAIPHDKRPLWGLKDSNYVCRVSPFAWLNDSRDQLWQPRPLERKGGGRKEPELHDVRARGHLQPACHKRCIIDPRHVHSSKIAHLTSIRYSVNTQARHYAVCMWLQSQDFPLQGHRAADIAVFVFTARRSNAPRLISAP